MQIAEKVPNSTHAKLKIQNVPLMTNKAHFNEWPSPGMGTRVGTLFR